MWIVYSPRGAYPQVPRPGEGTEYKGVHRPPVGAASFWWDAPRGYKNEDVQREYRVTAAEVMMRRNKDDIDRDRILEERPGKLAEVEAESESRQLAVFKVNPKTSELRAVRVLLAQVVVMCAKLRREAKGAGNAQESRDLDGWEAKADQIEAINSAVETIRAEINSSTSPWDIDVKNHSAWG